MSNSAAPLVLLDYEALYDLADFDGWLGGGLCCPDDPLDDVLGVRAACNDGFADEPVKEKDPSGPVPAEEFDVDMFFADDGGGAASDYAPSHAAVLPAAAPRVPTEGVVPYLAPPPRDVLDGVAPVFAHDLFDTVSAPPLVPQNDTLAAGSLVPYCAPPPPAHVDALLPAQPPKTTASWSSTSLMTCWEPSSPPPRALSPLRAPSWAVVPRKKRTRPITRRNYFWLPKSRLHPAAAKPPPPRRAAAAAAAPPPPPTTTTSGLKPGNNKTKRPAAAAAENKPRQRNRQRQRACTHCSNTETPQWRAGPRGPGTLCNACGIRYKQQNGLLFEEYRPSTSPSFESGKHSNRHRKVVKLREKKQALLKLVAGGADDHTVLPAATTSGGGGGGEFMDVCTYISTG
ncbi:hypothetical protein QOZ80_9BG0693700 [Eleusine coracana subsp. coracana]|nr:hypothetical protein QOZ80_9BG0693700 [Eleusine coracana subsp. coracana]